MYNVFKLLRTQFTAGLFWRLINRNFSFLCYFLSLSCFFKIICVVTRAWYFLTFMFMETKNAIRSTHFNSLLGSFQTANTLYNAMLRIARNFLETRENIKISTHPFYHINLGWFSWEWSKKNIFFFRKKNSKWPTQKKLIFQNRQFSKFFRENLWDRSLG